MGTSTGIHLTRGLSPFRNFMAFMTGQDRDIGAPCHSYDLVQVKGSSPLEAFMATLLPLKDLIET